jgi:hypothetical protein
MSDNEPDDIENATHNTFLKLREVPKLILNIVLF